jgi:hypothetical protein
MPTSKNHGNQINVLTHNEAAWDQQALLPYDWSKPVSSELIAEAKNGQWAVHISGFYEDEHPTPRFLIEKYLPTMIATRAVKQ